VTAVTVVAFTTETLIAAVPPIVTLDVPVRFDPVIVISVPPAVDPEFGATDEIVGARHTCPQLLSTTDRSAPSTTPSPFTSASQGVCARAENETASARRHANTDAVEPSHRCIANLRVLRTTAAEGVSDNAPNSRGHPPASGGDFGF